jgi:phage baseplate assembly protein W
MTLPAPVDARAFLGVGLALPLGTRPDGTVDVAAYEDDIRQAIRIILDTTPGERVMRPDFGAGLAAFAFEPMNATTIALVKHRTEEALVAWEPRIDSISVDVTAGASHGRVMIDVRYRVRATNVFYNLVYPFYLLESGEALR